MHIFVDVAIYILLFFFIFVERFVTCFQLVRFVHPHVTVRLALGRIDEFRLPTTELVMKKKGGTNFKPLRLQGKSGEYISPNNLRIVGGKVRGRKIESPDVHLRPMMSKVSVRFYFY